VFCALHRPTTLPEAEAVIDELVDVIDESGDAVRSRLRELVPEYDSHCVPDERPPVPRKAHAK
jgi:hypothetical protein